MTSPQRTPAQLYALVFGVVLVSVGVLGFIADASFGDPGSNIEGDELLVFEVNGWHNVVHIASGAIGLAVAVSPAASRTFALGFGAVYMAVTIWGFVDGNSVAWLLPVNPADNILHLGIAAAGIGAGVATPRPARVRAAAG